MCCMLKTPHCLSGWLSSFGEGLVVVYVAKTFTAGESKPTHKDALTLGLGRRVRPGSGLAGGELSAVEGGGGRMVWAGHRVRPRPWAGVFVHPPAGLGGVFIPHFIVLSSCEKFQHTEGH